MPSPPRAPRAQLGGTLRRITTGPIARIENAHAFARQAEVRVQCVGHEPRIGDHRVAGDSACRRTRARAPRFPPAAACGTWRLDSLARLWTKTRSAVGKRQTVIDDHRTLRAQPFDVGRGAAARANAGTQPELQRTALAGDDGRHAGRASAAPLRLEQLAGAAARVEAWPIEHDRHAAAPPATTLRCSMKPSMTAITSRTWAAKFGCASTCALAARAQRLETARVVENASDLRGQALGIDGARLAERIGSGIVDALRQARRGRRRARRSASSGSVGATRAAADAVRHGFGQAVDARRDDGAAMRRRLDRDEPERFGDRRVQQAIDARVERASCRRRRRETCTCSASPKLAANEREARQLRAGARDVELDVEDARRSTATACSTIASPFTGIQARGRAELDRARAESASRCGAAGAGSAAARCGTRARRRDSPRAAAARARPPSSSRSRAARARDIAPLGVAPGVPRGAVLPVDAARAPSASRANRVLAVRFQITSTSVRAAASARRQCHARNACGRRAAATHSGASHRSRARARRRRASAMNGCIAPAAFSQPCATARDS